MIVGLAVSIFAFADWSPSLKNGLQNNFYEYSLAIYSTIITNEDLKEDFYFSYITESLFKTNIIYKTQIISNYYYYYEVLDMERQLVVLEVFVVGLSMVDIVQ